MQYAVHLFTQVRLKVVNIESSSPASALAIAIEKVNLHDELNRINAKVSSEVIDVAHVEYSEDGIHHALVDQLNDKGEFVPDKTFWLDREGHELKDLKTTDELKVDGYNRAERFMQELVHETESLGAVAEQYGTQTVIDVTYLQSAIMKGTFISVFVNGTSKIRDVINLLPSKTDWDKYIEDVE